jgi:hypothetical protein
MLIKQKQNIRTKTNRGKTLKRFESHKIFFYNDLFREKKVGAFWPVTNKNTQAKVL